MAIKIVVYFQEFKSQTKGPDRIDKKPYQGKNEEDTNIRQEIRNKFIFSEKLPLSYQNCVGFDGEFHYSFSIDYNLPMNSSTKSRKYITQISITKAGAENQLEKLCDLERFIINKGFKREEENIPEPKPRKPKKDWVATFANIEARRRYPHYFD